jgi:hypothetical protein
VSWTGNPEVMDEDSSFRIADQDEAAGGADPQEAPLICPEELVDYAR